MFLEIDPDAADVGLAFGEFSGVCHEEGPGAAEEEVEVGRGLGWAVDEAENEGLDGAEADEDPQQDEDAGDDEGEGPAAGGVFLQKGIDACGKGENGGGGGDDGS